MAKHINSKVSVNYEHCKKWMLTSLLWYDKPQAPMEGFWAPTPLGQTPTSHYSDDAPTTQPYMEVANKSAEKKQIKTKSSPDAPAAVFKRSDGESAHHRRGVDGVQRGTPLRGTAARSVSVL